MAILCEGSAPAHARNYVLLNWAIKGEIKRIITKYLQELEREKLQQNKSDFTKTNPWCLLMYSTFNKLDVKQIGSHSSLEWSVLLLLLL